jgi:hypothetical protein
MDPYGFLGMAQLLLENMPMIDHHEFQAEQLIRVLIFTGISYGVQGNVQNDS